MTSNVSIGVIGLGYWGPNHVRNLVALGSEGALIKAVADRDPARRLRIERQYPQLTVLNDAEAIIADPTIDAVVVATPVSTHYGLTKAALEAGKHVLVEKPMVASLAHGKDLIRIAKERELTLMAGHTFLYTAAVNRMRDLVAAGDLGEVMTVRSLRVNLGLYQHDINVLWDLAPHDISILLYVLNDVPVEVSAVGSAHLTKRVEDVVTLTLFFRSGVTATTVLSWLDPRKVREMTVIGSKKMLVYDDISTTEKIRIFDKGVDGPREYETFGEFQYSYRYGDITSPMLTEIEPLREELLDFVNSIQYSKTPKASAESALDVVRTLAAAQLSINQRGAPVQLDDPLVSGMHGVRSK
ncbi:MAG TPA: Gfo/Idh/MocA family oxidoreductase [Acidimicrobiia bacterium]|jgi:predicted dehydrogenase